MRAGNLAGKLSTYGEGLERVGAINAAAGVAALSGLLLRLKAKSVADVAVLLRLANREGLATGKPSIAELLTALWVLEDLAPALETKKQNDLVEALTQLRSALAGFESFSVESYMQGLSSRVRVVSASRQRRGPADVNEAVVSDYLRRLEKALPDANSFAGLFAELLADDRVQQAEAVALASRFLSPTSASTSRAKALAKVMERHATLIRARTSRRAGKSAA